MGDDQSREFETTPLTDELLDEAVAFARAANPFCQHTWGWDVGRFIDFRWGFNTVSDTESPGFFERNCAVVRCAGEVVALVVAETGEDDHCILTADEDAQLVDWALRDLLARRDGERVVLIPSDDATWVHEVIGRHGFVQGEAAGLEWGYDLTDVPEPVVPEGFVVEAIRGPEDYAGVGRCAALAFGSDPDRDRAPVMASLATNPMYDRALSVVARAHNGDIAAYCKGEVDPDTGVAGIDPVATHPDYQRLGLGRAVVLRCFAEQRRLGGTMSFIGSGPEGSAGSRLYRRLNPVSATSHSEWTQPTPPISTEARLEQ